MADLQSKLQALLASTTHEGEAMAAWRKLRKVKPEGDLFPLHPVSDRVQINQSAVRAAYARGFLEGQKEGYRNGRKEVLESLQDLDFLPALSRALDREPLWKVSLRLLLAATSHSTKQMFKLIEPLLIIARWGFAVWCVLWLIGIDLGGLV